MQSQPDHNLPLPRRPSSCFQSRSPSSPTSLAPPSPTATIDASANHHPLHHEAQPSLHRQPSAPPSQTTKLDGVLYHFYTTTANLVIQARLAHLRPLLLTPPFDHAIAHHRPPSASRTPSQPKLSRWFGLHIPDTDLFKDELRLCRSVTSLLALSTHDAPTPTPTSATAAAATNNSSAESAVPDLIIDVMLDLSNVSHRHQVLLLTHTRPARRVCIDGRAPGESSTSPSQPASRPQRIVLERWRLRFDTSQPANPPDLSTFYKRSVVHFRALFTLLCALPANRLCARIQALKAAPDTQSDPTRSSFPSLVARGDTGTHDAEMTIGCRLSMSGIDLESDSALPGGPQLEVAASHALPPEQGMAATDTKDADGQQPDVRLELHGHYATQTFMPIATPVGHLALSVTYRNLTGFSVEDTESLRTAHDIKVDVDEDYFKPLPADDRTPRNDSSSPSSLAPAPFAPSTTTTTTTTTTNGAERTSASATSALAAHPPISGLSAARPAVLAAQRTPSDSAVQASRPPHSIGSETSPVSQSPANPSVFSTSATGRNTAGLSSLRRTGSSSIKSNLSLVGSSQPPPAPSSPALAAALSAEPAFVLPSSARRMSITERRLRTLSGVSSGQPSLSSSPASNTLELPPTSAPQLASVSGRSISTRVASDFVVPPTPGTVAPAGPSRPGISFSPSSPSPLAQQMSMHATRPTGTGGPAMATYGSASSFRSVSSSSLRSSIAAGTTQAAPSLRSVFQNYVPRSQNHSSTVISRTPPTSSSSAFVQTSYSPSNLGTGLRSSSIRRNSSTSDAGSGSAFGPSASSTSAAAAAKPQMIKRYSTNFSYRQNRERSGIYGSSLGSEGSGYAGAGGEPSSYPRFGAAGGSFSSAYGRSWVSRMEQRQGLGTGGAFARTSSLDDATAAATASAASRYRASSTTDAAHLGNLTPSPRSHEEDMDDLVRLLETRPAFGTSSMGKLTSLRNERRNAPGLSSTPEEGTSLRSGQALADSIRSNSGADRPGSLSGSGLRSGGGIRTANPMSRSQLDDLLSRMAESVGILSGKDPDSGASAETPSDPATSDEARLRGGVSSASAPAKDPAAQTSHRLTSASGSAAVGGVRGYSAIEAERQSAEPAGRLSTPGALVAGTMGEALISRPRGTATQVRAYSTAAAHAASNAAADAPESGGLRDGGLGGSLAAPASRSDAAGGASATAAIPEYEAEGDLMFGVDAQPEYDPEDDLAGEMEMATEETARERVGGAGAAPASSTTTYARSAEAGMTAFGGGVEGGMGATLPVGAHREGRALERVRSGPMNDWQVAERWERERMQEAERRRADAEMSRNFGQEVGASTRGRGSHSPWRATPHATPASATAMAAPASVQPQPSSSLASAGALGFRSSSSRPFAASNRLVGMAGAYGSSAAQVPAGALAGEARRGYGVSAPSTQFHYQPPHSAPNRPTPSSYPVSRDEMYDEDDEEDDDNESLRR